MKLLHERVNIVPVIGKADTLTKRELADLKQKVCSHYIFFNCLVEMMQYTEQKFVMLHCLILTVLLIGYRSIRLFFNSVDV